MKLFEILPHNLFSILNSKNREVYVEALFVIRRAFKQEMSINKSDLVSMLIANLDEIIYQMDLSEEDDADNGNTYDNERDGAGLSSTAHFILRRLRDTGWIEAEYRIDSFEENITLPDYSVKLINLLYSFTDESIREYNSYVYSTYSALKTADQERDDYMYDALLTAHGNTVKLVDELKTLHNNIRRYHQALNEYATVNDILRGHFDEYKNLIMDRIYHPLKTLDSVPRFKNPIVRILGGWVRDQSIREGLEKQAMLRGRYDSKEEAAGDIMQKIHETMDTYETLDHMLEEIDRKNSAYTRASIEKMRYMLNTDRSIKGKLVELLTRAAESEGGAGRTLVEALGDCTEVFRQGYVDGSSLYTPRVRKVRKDEKPMEMHPVDHEAGEKGFEEFLDRAKRSYSHTRVMDFVRSVMGQMDVITGKEIPLPDDEAFILLMLASLKGGERSAFYKVEFTKGYIDNNGYRIPNMRFIRKGTTHNVE
ncbi:MAG: Wadjet anti-phage system protein JetA family protein [Bacillota bacterium]|nr:DUF5716 family protein [Bacillota bacterium]MDD3851300.1 DUF5716 family protein [Bacillota bacterium]MDD4708098.1 DUF5716 family protein [Bacillota bacterium]